MQQVYRDTANEAWKNTLKRLVCFGEPASPRGKQTREIRNVQIDLDLRYPIVCHPLRGLNYRFMVAEWLWIRFGLNELNPLLRFNPNMSQYSDDGKILSGAYGPQVIMQMPWVIQKLTEDTSSRQAVLSIWQAMPSASKDIPCTLTLQFFERRGFIHLTVNMRSSDVWLGLPYDIFVFSQLAREVAGTMGLLPGRLTMNLGSSHLYEEHYHHALMVARDGDSFVEFNIPNLDGPPPPALQPILMGAPMSDLIQLPWRTYANMLLARTSAEALEALNATNA